MPLAVGVRDGLRNASVRKAPPPLLCGANRQELSLPLFSCCCSSSSAPLPASAVFFLRFELLRLKRFKLGIRCMPISGVLMVAEVLVDGSVGGVSTLLACEAFDGVTNVAVVVAVDVNGIAPVVTTTAAFSGDISMLLTALPPPQPPAPPLVMRTPPAPGPALAPVPAGSDMLGVDTVEIVVGTKIGPEALASEFFEISSMTTLCILLLLLRALGSKLLLLVTKLQLLRLVLLPCSWLAFSIFNGLCVSTGDGGIRSIDGMPSSSERWPPLKRVGGLSSDGEPGHCT